MSAVIQLGSLEVDVTKKDIKNVHLSIYPPAGQVRISAPKHMRLESIRAFAASKLDWIKRERKKVREQERETQRQYVNRESHYLWGKRYLLKVVEAEESPRVKQKHSQLILHVRPGSDRDKKREVMMQWYRSLIKEEAVALIKEWEPKMKVKVSNLFVQRMKTKWGSCNPVAGNIRLNSELAKKPLECLEYILVHEMVHLLEPTHNHRFVKLMNRFMPQWTQHRDALNRLPVRHEDWVY